MHTYDYLFAEHTLMAGCCKLKVFVSCQNHNDLDVYVIIRELSVDSELMEKSNVPLHLLPGNVKTVKYVKNVNLPSTIGPLKCCANHTAVLIRRSLPNS